MRKLFGIGIENYIEKKIKKLANFYNDEHAKGNMELVYVLYT